MKNANKKKDKAVSKPSRTPRGFGTGSRPMKAGDPTDLGGEAERRRIQNAADDRAEARLKQASEAMNSDDPGKRREWAVKALASFLSKSQAPLSILMDPRMGASGHMKPLHEAWCEARLALGLNGWHDEAAAEKAIRKAFGL